MKINKQLKKTLKHGAFIFAIVLSNVLFWGSYHNLDLLQNYALIYNDINSQHCTHDFINIRNIKDCNALYDCPDFQTIYIHSKFMQFAAYFIMLGIIISLVDGCV